MWKFFYTSKKTFFICHFTRSRSCNWLFTGSFLVRLMTERLSVIAASLTAALWEIWSRFQKPQSMAYSVHPCNPIMSVQIVIGACSSSQHPAQWSLVDVRPLGAKFSCVVAPSSDGLRAAKSLWILTVNPSQRGVKFVLCMILYFLENGLSLFWWLIASMWERH